MTSNVNLQNDELALNWERGQEKVTKQTNLLLLGSDKEKKDWNIFSITIFFWKTRKNVNFRQYELKVHVGWLK